MPRPRPLRHGEAGRTLAHRLATRVDRLRQFSTRFGLRSVRAFLVWTKYTGEERGEGREVEVHRVEMLPTPKVSDLSSITLNPYSAGVFPVGTVRLDLISAAFTREQLMGRELPASEQPNTAIAEPYDFFYELVDDDRTTQNPLRAKFRPLSAPARREGNVCWSIMLERVSEDRTTQGQSTYLDREEGD
jgi:hypothetical protein